MSTLLLRLAAPLQAWGADSKFNRRMTSREPTKSGVVGLIASALGRRRCDGIEDLCRLRFGVRVDQPGSLVRDYHVARANHHYQKQAKGSECYISERYYLADAVFLVGLEGEELLLREIEGAIQSPVFPLFLGRRSCPPTGRVSLSIRQKTLDEALCEEPSQASVWYKKSQMGKKHLLHEIIRDASDGEKPIFGTQDAPLSFDQRDRRFTFRGTIRKNAVLRETAHDPLANIDEVTKGKE